MYLVLCVILMLTGLFLLYKGGDLFTESCIFMSGILPFSPLVTGATVVSAANAFPDFLVSFSAAVKGYPDMSVGNSLGAVICNLGLVIGIANILHPSFIRSRYFAWKAFIMLFCGFLLYFISRDNVINHRDAALLISLFTLYTIVGIFLIRMKTRQYHLRGLSINHKSPDFKYNLFTFFLGLILLWVGSALLLKYGIHLSGMLGIPERTVAISIVAFGTSLPELTTTLIACRKGYFSIALGNIIGTNILNIMLVLGLSAAARPLMVHQSILLLDIPFLIILMILFVVPTVLMKRITRSLAVTLVILYFTHLVLLWGFGI